MFLAYFTTVFRGIFGSLTLGLGVSLVINWFQGNIIVNNTTDLTWSVVGFFICCIALVFTGAYNVWNCTDSIDRVFERKN